MNSILMIFIIMASMFLGSFLDFSVEQGEFYLSDLLKQVQKTHQERLKQEGVTLRILQSENYLLQGDQFFDHVRGRLCLINNRKYRMYTESGRVDLYFRQFSERI